MMDIKGRLRAISNYSELHPRPFEPRIETEILSLQFRSIFELIVLANLVANKDDFNRLYKDIEHQWRPDKIISRIKTINPKYYPRPVVPDVPNKKIHDYAGTDYLTEGDLLFANDLCSKFIHAENPFSKPRDGRIIQAQFSPWYFKIKRLLENHVVTLSQTNKMIFVEANLDADSNPYIIYAGEA